MITFIYILLTQKASSVQLIFSESATMCEGRGLAKRHLGGQNENNLVMKRLLSVKCYYASAQHVGETMECLFSSFIK